MHNNGDQLKNVWMLAYDLVNGNWQEVNRKQVNYAYKPTGALSGVGTNMLGNDPNAATNVLSNTSFRATGAIKQLDYGNGLRLEMGYSAQRQQPTSMKVAPISNPNAPVLSYGYNYYDANSNNNNRIRKITDNVDGNYTTDYTYDSYNRLLHATGPSLERHYSYDPWGNLLEVYGNGWGLLQKINVAMTGGWGGGAPLTNRILNVQENGQTLAHSYDASGNMTNDGQKTYQYDGAGRMTSVNAGALGTYGYNGDGKRVKKVEGGSYDLLRLFGGAGGGGV